MKPHVRFVIVALLIAGTAYYLSARGQGEVVLAHQPLSGFPAQLGPWTGTNLKMPQDVLDILGPGDFLLRDYESQGLDPSSVNLFIAYFPSQRAGDVIHSPKNCLPGSGWAPIEARHVTVAVPGHTQFPANRYLITKGGSRMLVLYWYWAHNRAVASEYWAKYYLVADSIRMNRTDGSLIRLTTPLVAGESIDTAQQRLLSFASLVVPQINRFVPR